MMRELTLHDLTDIGGGNVVNGAFVNSVAAVIRGVLGSASTDLSLGSAIDSAQRGWVLTTAIDYGCMNLAQAGGGGNEHYIRLTCGTLSALLQSYARWPITNSDQA
ncbi:hypothetical protein [Bordetella sp. 02P26C-1]|uniref:hypothetical protein n=1 Tax=Bordetella sp. 02P26C-1 TaxID=2683195 RepID=UPI001352D30E|nr:hypothetical protein [Bordetella sp. 02P26C-1]MVW80572.1 hypothetical protein [Bordetella sp. 02P26C-1]